MLCTCSKGKFLHTLEGIDFSSFASVLDVTYIKKLYTQDWGSLVRSILYNYVELTLRG